MNDVGPLNTKTLSVARLLIHTRDAPISRNRRVMSALHYLRALYTHATKWQAHGSVNLKIVDLQGCPVYVATVAGSLIEVVLPAGTYHVTADLDTQRRSYTMALAQGAVFDLYLTLNELKEF